MTCRATPSQTLMNADAACACTLRGGIGSDAIEPCGTTRRPGFRRLERRNEDREHLLMEMVLDDLLEFEAVINHHH
jgi:hypothetical protein